MAGRLVGKALQNQLKDRSPLHTLANRVANLAKRIFSKITGNDIQYNALKAEQVADRIAYGFVHGDNSFSVDNALSYQEILNDAPLSVSQRTFRDAVDSLGRMCKELEAVSNDMFENKMEASLGEAMFAAHDTASNQSTLQMSPTVFADSLAFDGIVQVLVQIYDYLGPGKEIDSMLSAVDMDNKTDFYVNMAKNGRRLRQVRIFHTNALNAVNIISQALHDNSLTLPNGTTLQDTKYQDIYGVWHSIDMNKALSNCETILSAVGRDLASKECAFFARFCEDIYGKNYVDATVGKLWRNIWNGDEQQEYAPVSIEALVSGKEDSVSDIDVFHRYLGSMSNNPDIIGQIVDKAVKIANRVADEETLRYQNRLIVLKQRAEKLKLNLADLVERDDNGVPTGNMITPPVSVESDMDAFNAYVDDDPDFADSPYAVNHGAWEKKREEHKKQIWEQFKKDNPTWESWSSFALGMEWDRVYRDEYKKWNQQNSIRVEYTDPATGETYKVTWMPNKLYKTDAWENLQQKYKGSSEDNIGLWMRDYMQIKNELDSMLPQGATVSYRLPQFRGTFNDSLRNANISVGFVGRVKNFAKNFWRRDIIDAFCLNSQDTDYGDLNTINHPDEMLGTKLDYERERPNRLPIFGINKIENMQDLSTDILQSMLAYASMATTYQSLDNIVDSLEVGANQNFYNRTV